MHGDTAQPLCMCSELTQSYDIDIYNEDGFLLWFSAELPHAVVGQLHPGLQHQGQCMLSKVPPVLYLSWSDVCKVQQTLPLLKQIPVGQPNM